MNISRLCLLVLIVTGIFLCILPVTATVWNAASDFSVTNGNPNGVWTYGWKPVDGVGALTPYPNSHPNGAGYGLMEWQDNAHSSGTDNYGWILMNPTTVPITLPWGVYFDVNGIDMQCGVAGQQTTIRWTSPVDGWVKFSTSFAIYSGWGAPGGFVTVNDQLVYSVDMLGNAVPGHEGGGTSFPTHGSYSNKLLVHANDKIDVSVDYGPDSYWGGDATGITFVVETTTQPSMVSGVVKSSLPGNNGISGVTVETASGPYSTTTTDATGHYSMMADPGTRSLMFSRSDCVSHQEDNVIVVDGQTTTVNVTLTTAKTTWNAASEFSNVTSLNREWSYGYRPLDLGASGFTPYTVVTNIGSYGIFGWDAPGETSRGTIIWNSDHDYPLQVPWGTWWDSNGIDMHPGVAGDRSTIRWTSPLSGWVDVSTLFKGMNPSQTTSEGDLIVNGVAVWGAFITGFAGEPGTGAGAAGPDPQVTHNQRFWVEPGDTVDCSVGWGWNGTWDGDSTGINFNIAMSTDPHSTISGNVKSSASGNPVLAGVRVTTTTGGYAATTKADGNYSMVVAPGTYTVKFDKDGFTSYQAPAVTVAADATEVVNATLTSNQKVIGTSNKAVLGALMQTAAGKYTWVLWGKVTVVDSSHFTIDDGSGVTINVVAPNVTVANGDYVSVKGALDVSGATPTLTSQQVTIQHSAL